MRCIHKTSLMFLAAFLMVFLVSAFAIANSLESYDDRGDLLPLDFKPGDVVITLKDGALKDPITDPLALLKDPVAALMIVEGLFPELSIKSARYCGGNTFGLTLTEYSKDAVTKALALLKDNPYIKSATPNYIVTATARGSVLSHNYRTAATVTLRDSEGNTVASAATVADGSYSLAVPVAASAPAAETYTLTVRQPGCLTYTERNLTVVAGQPIPTIDLRPLAGDINGDGVINSVDLTYLLSEFNKNPGTHPYADVNGDGIVNSVDLTYLLAGFNKKDVVN